MYYSDDSDIEIRSLSDDSEVSNSDESIRSASPAPSDSDESIYSLSSSVYGQRLRDYNGRLFNTIHEAYIMPSDEEEHVRHDIQHRCLSYAIGSLYASPERVRAALAPNPNYTPAIIDIGTGAGSWAIEMALEFPHAEVLGIDLAPPITHMPIPDNCRFEVDDCNLPLTHYMNSYNVAHLRSVEFGLDDYEGVINEVALILRQGGIILLAGGDLRLYNHDRKPLPDVAEGEEGFTWCQRIFTAILDASKNRGCKSWNARALWHGWLEQNPNYEDVHTFDVLIPIGPWQKGPGINDRINYISELMRLDLLRLFRSCRPMLVGDGYPASMVDRWLTNVEVEFQKLELKAFAKWRYTSARRRNALFVAT